MQHSLVVSFQMVGSLLYKLSTKVN